MNVFIGMEESQVIQRAFESRGHNAWSCDLKPARLNASRHFQGDVHQVLAGLRWTPDLIVLHPVCRLLSSSGQHWKDKPGQRTSEETEEAVADFLACTFYAGRVCIENPIGIMTKRWRKWDQIFHPWQFGDDASKATCLWLQSLPPLVLDPSQFIEPRWVCCGLVLPAGVGKYGCSNCEGTKRALPRWGNQTDSGQNRLGPTADPEDRRAARAETYVGPANAMADQWGSL